MSKVLDREKSLALLHRYIKNPNMIKHCLATEAVMIALAKKLNTDKDKWACAGLLHDLDIEITNADLNLHCLETEKILKDLDLDPEIIMTIKMHNEVASKQKRKTVFEHALAAGETITGLIIATTLVYPDKKLASVKPKSIIKRMKEKAFAAKVNRDIIRECESINIPLPEFAGLCLKAMQTVSDQLGL